MPECAKCRKYYTGHECSCRLYEIRLEDDEEDDWYTIRARYEEEAAEEFCQDIDSGSGEEPERNRTVIVKLGDKTWRLSVEAEFDVMYHAYEI